MSFIISPKVKTNKMKRANFSGKFKIEFVDSKTKPARTQKRTHKAIKKVAIIGNLFRRKGGKI